ncbi:glycosyltransferase [Paenibacillus oleatilyticus]|uniref:Glycosyltransferase n=1 Tax=Paenibacillus oleatilyticus TaxID=2594886 RepID=A0ABV4V7W4_9BACL
MNANKICFITCYNDEALYHECLNYVYSLDIPEGFEIETRGIYGAVSMAAGYNNAMSSSDAKYKIYLHQDTFLINKSFLNDCLKLFKNDNELGMLGMVGTKKLPPSCVWWEGRDLIGEVFESHTGKMELLQFRKTRDSYEEVESIDGFLMVTQYDIPWREDVFNGWHFYDISQSLEFRMAGYKVGIPNQLSSWAIHDCGIVQTNNGFEIYKRDFIEIYSDFLFPPGQGYRRHKDGFRIIALVACHNDGDIIYHVIGDLIQQGVEVYLINHCSTDNTVEEASKWLGKGLIHIENFPEDAGYPEENKTQYIWKDILQRKQELSMLLDADWFIHHDSDEFRESPWNGLSLSKAIEIVDRSGYNAINFKLLNFRPTNNHFEPGSDVREALTHFEWGEHFNRLQLKAWKNFHQPVDLVSNAGHVIEFDGKKVYPINFILRHYPIRSQVHGVQKVINERKKRFNEIEKNVNGWHIQYDHIENEEHSFLYKKEDLIEFDARLVRKQNLNEAGQNKIICNEIENVIEVLENEKNLTYIKDLEIYLNEIKLLNGRKKPKVTILITTYNQKEYLKQAIESALKQDYENLEVLVADDCSTDGTDVVMQAYTTNKKVRYIRHSSNLGAGNNTKYVFYNYVDSDYVLILNHDDFFIDDSYISKAAELLTENPNVSFVTANCIIYDVEKNEYKKTNYVEENVINGLDYFLNYETSKYHHITSVLTTLFRRENAVRMSCFNEEAKCLDLFLHLKLMLTGDVGFIHDHVGVYRIHKNSISGSLPEGYDFLTINELENLKNYVMKEYRVQKENLETWINIQVLTYVRWRIPYLWKTNKKLALELLMGISNKYPMAYNHILETI